MNRTVAIQSYISEDYNFALYIHENYSSYESGESFRLKF
jgi:hypothetical protein